MTHQFNFFEAFQTPANLLSSFLNSVQKWNHTYINLNQLIYSSCGKLFRWNTSWLIFLMRATCEEIYLWLGLESSLTQHIFVVSFELCTDSKWKNLFESDLNVTIPELMNFGIHFFKILKDRTRNKFWKDILQCWILF